MRMTAGSSAGPMSFRLVASTKMKQRRDGGAHHGCDCHYSAPQPFAKPGSPLRAQPRIALLGDVLFRLIQKAQYIRAVSSVIRFLPPLIAGEQMPREGASGRPVADRSRGLAGPPV